MAHLTKDIAFHRQAEWIYLLDSGWMIECAILQARPTVTLGLGVGAAAG